ncbi:MAG: tetratricopeptide repeat protein [Candidatus Amulumruptor caecigallinarius]|nr:tetratricopeptide repeat protein [Candidatus Amulumruptor caecigallinarius]
MTKTEACMASAGQLKRLLRAACVLAAALVCAPAIHAQIDAEQVIRIGRNVLAMDDYMLSIQYFNQAIKAKPYLSDPYYLRGLAKLSLEDYKGAEEDGTLAIDRNKFKTESYRLRGFARQSLGKDSLAIEDYNMGLRHNPQDKYFLFYKAVAQTELKDYAGADSTFSFLLRIYPRFEEGYTARGRLQMVRGDTVRALEDVSKAISMNQNLIQPFLLRAEIESKQKNWQDALNDMDYAVKLRPHEADLYVNRAYLRYNLDDYFGAMADYNYALELQPFNNAALYNRALLRYEVKDLNRAARDFNEVLRLQPDNFHARYNLGLIEMERGNNGDALQQFDAIARKYPRFYPVYYARAEALRSMGNMRAAMQSAYHADELVKSYVKNPERNPLDRPAILAGTSNNSGVEARENESEDEVMNRFNQLVTVGGTSGTRLAYNDKIKGRVQDRNMPVTLEPAYMLSFREMPQSLQTTSNYFRELDEFNNSRYLAGRLSLSPDEHEEKSYDDIFALADCYDKVTKQPGARPADWLALGVARAMLKDYDAALRALNRAIEMVPGFTMAYLERAFVLQHCGDPMKAPLAVSDYDEALRLNPRLIYAYFNKGNLYYELGDYTSALSCYSAALETDSQFGAAYFNRGLTYLKMGNKRRAFDDLSKAGELGVLPSYNLLKRMK